MGGMSAEPAAKAGEAAPSAATEPAMIAAAFEYFIFSNPFPRRVLRRRQG
jgi:hypothetical protein